MKGKEIQIGLIGAGRAGMIHAVNFGNCIPGARLAAVADPNRQAAEETCRLLGINSCYSDYKELLKNREIDAVVVVTPTKYHCEIVVEAAYAGKHILCEKPMAMTGEECGRMICACRENRVKLQLAFMRRFDPAYREAKKMVEQGEIGNVVMIRSNTRGPSTPKPWMYDIAKSNGPLAEVNSHDIDTLRWFAGSEIGSLYAIGGNYRCPDARKDFPDFYDNVAMIVKFQNGIQGIIDGAQGVRYGYDARTEILGTEGCIFLGRTREKAILVCRSDGTRQDEFTNSWRYLFKEAYEAEDRAFVSCILEDRDPEITGKDGLEAVRVVNAGNESIRSGSIVYLEES